MKKSILTLIFSLYTIVSFSQAASNFNDATGDGKWSTAGNWSDGIPVSTTKVTLLKSVTLDVDATIKQLKTSASSDNTVIVTGEAGKVLTITATGVGQPIQVGGASKTLDLSAVSVAITPGDNAEALAINGATSNLTLGTFSSAQHINLFGQAGATNPRTFTLNGPYSSSKWLQFKSNSTIVFGENYDPTGHTNNMRFLDSGQGAARVTVKGTNWLKPALKIIAAYTESTKAVGNGKLTLDGENALKGSIELQSTANMFLTVNRNQSAKNIIMGSGTLEITLGDDVTSLAFADNSAQNWGTGKIKIVNFKDDVVSFGSDANGITADQLAQIDIGGATVVMGSDGKLSTEKTEVAVSTFNNATGDKLWSTAGNWSDGIPNVTKAKVTLTDSLILDTDVEIAQIKLGAGTGDVAVTSSNGSTLTLSGINVTQPIQNNRAESNLNLDLKVVFNSTDEVETIQASAAGECTVTFGASSDVTVNVHTKLMAQADRIINFNGILRNTGNGRLYVGPTSEVVFGSTSDNSNYTDDIWLNGNNGVLTSNTADDGTFIKSTKGIVITDAKGYGHVININGKNTYKGYINVKDTALTYNFNADQASVGVISLGAGNLNLTLGNNVSNLAFAKTTQEDWGSGNVVITNFKDNVISFGGSADGITSNQLAAIDIGGGAEVTINSSGQISEVTKSDLMIVGISDPDGGDDGTVKTTYLARGIELYAIADIPDLSKYGLGSANNGGGTDGVEWNFPQVAVTAGTTISLGRDSAEYRNYYGYDYDYNAGGAVMGYNGDDAIELFYNSTAIDVFGDINAKGGYWTYTDGWAYRKNGSAPTTVFDTLGWNYSGINANDDFATNAASDNPFPAKSYKTYKEDLMILGVVDPDGGTDPDNPDNSTNYSARAIEIYVINDIADLSKYGLGCANNGGGTDGVEWNFPAESATAGSFILLGRDSAQARTYYGVDIDYNAGGSVLGYNGDDAIELFYGETLIDTYGNADEKGGDWTYTDGWAHRKNGKTLSPTFNANDWEISGINVTDDFYTNALNTTKPYPLATYSAKASPTSVFLGAASGSVSEDAGTFNIEVNIIDPSPDTVTSVHLVYTGPDSTDVSLFTVDTVVFAAGSSDAVNVSIQINDDTDAEGEEVHTFELQNIAGGTPPSTIGSPSTFALTINDDDIAEFNFVYNELHIDPASDITGDANGDGTRDAIADEFIELINTGSTAFDLSGYYLTDDTSPEGAPRHVFPSGSVAEPGMPVVVFGGGVPTSPTNFGGALVQTASENNGGVALGNSGKTIYVKNPDGLTVLSHTYLGSQGNINQSITRSPDITGDFVSHSGVSAANGALFSPGMKLDSTLLYTHTTTKVQLQVMKANAKEGTDASFDIGVTINGASTSTATEVTLGVSGGTGTSDDIDGFTSQTITFAAGETATKVVTINVSDDDLEEGNESIEFTLTNASGGDAASVFSPSMVTLNLSDDDISNPLILNELLTDPPSDDAATTDVVEGDANGDGTRDAFGDEFVELVNTNTSQLDISGYTISDGAGLRHTFPENTVLDGGKAAIVFGGGSPTGDFGGATVQTATGGTLSLNNGGDKVVITDNNGNIIIEFAWGGSTTYDGGADQSLTRDPDITGDFVLHTTTTSGGVYSPGTQVDGSAFDVGVNDPTTVQFSVSEDTKANADGSYDTGDYEIEVQISNPSPNVATQVEVVFTASDLGSAADISDYAGEVLTFSSGSTDPQVSTVTISSSSIELGTKYDFALQNVSGGNQASLGENTTFTLIVGDPGSVPLGIENNRTDILLSPNPTSDILKVSINNNKVLERFVINDMSGRSMMTKSYGKVVDYIEIDVRSFDNGLYILNLEFEDELAVLKFIRE